MIVAGSEGFIRSQYRKFNIKDPNISPGDDGHMMHHVLTRRFARLTKNNDINFSSSYPDLILVDEVGKLVSESKEFSAVLKEALKCGKPMLITMHKRSRNPLLQSIRKRDDLRTLEVTPINSAILPSKAVNILKTGMV